MDFDGQGRAAGLRAAAGSMDPRFFVAARCGLYLLMGVFSLPFRGAPMRRDQYMHSFIRASRSAVGVSAFVFAGLLASFVYRIILGDWLFLPEDWYFIAACAVIGMLSAGTVYFLRSIDLSERENAAFESKPL